MWPQFTLCNLDLDIRIAINPHAVQWVVEALGPSGCRAVISVGNVSHEVQETYEQVLKTIRVMDP